MLNGLCPYCMKEHDRRVACPEYNEMRKGEAALVADDFKFPWYTELWLSVLAFCEALYSVTRYGYEESNRRTTQKLIEVKQEYWRLRHGPDTPD